MLKLSTRLFAAGTLAALLISITQDGFAHEKTAKAGAKKAAMSCCVKKDGVAVCKDKAAVKIKTAKAAKPVAKTVSNAKIAPKAAVKGKAVKASGKTAEQGGSCCQDPDAQAA